MTAKKFEASDQEVLAALKSDTPLNRARRVFSDWCGRIEQATQQRHPASVFDMRAMEFQAVREIADELAPESFDLTTNTDKTSAFIQWKGTDVCLDFHCDCGADGHFDGRFAYVIRCPKCKTEWEMPWMLFPRKSQRDPDHLGIVDLQFDEDEE